MLPKGCYYFLNDFEITYCAISYKLKMQIMKAQDSKMTLQTK